MHGLPLAWAKFERVNVPNVGWRVAISGQNEIVRGTFAENGNKTQIAFAEPGWYLVVVQTETARAQTEIELETPTALAINTLGRWNVGGIVQPVNVAAAANGLADPVVQTITRQWMPHERVNMAWLIQTTNKDQPVRWRMTSGQTVGQHTVTVYAWRLFNYGGTGQKIQDADRLFVPVQTTHQAITATPAQYTANPWSNPIVANWHSVVSDANGQVFWLPECLPDYSHELVVKIKRSQNHSGINFVKLRVDSAQTTEIVDVFAAFDANESVYTAAIPARAVGDQITRVYLITTPGQRFDVQGKLNVSN